MQIFASPQQNQAQFTNKRTGKESYFQNGLLPSKLQIAYQN